MTRPTRDPELPPVAELPPLVRTGAGNPALVVLSLVNPAAAPRQFTVTVLGLDAGWLPLPVHVGPLPPGGGAFVELALRPPSGTLPASYPFSVAVQAADPRTGLPVSATTMVESALLVDELSRLTMTVAPTDASAVFGRRIEVELRNVGGSPAQVELRTEVSDGAALRLSRHRLELPSGATARIRGRVALTRPRMIGGRSRHPFLIAARGLGAPSSVTGSITARPLLSPFGTRVLAIVAVLSVWLALAAVGLGKLASSMRGNQDGSKAAATAAPSGSGSAGNGGSGGSSGGGSGNGGSSGGGSSGSSGGGAGSGGAAGVRVNGIVTAVAPAGVTVSLQPTSLVDESAEGAQPVGESAKSMATELQVVGKISGQQLAARAQSTVSRKLSTSTAANGSWAFAGISSPGYYLLTFTKPGYQTRKYILNASDADASKPLAVTMTAGAGRLSGTITGPSGPVGGATISITDGADTMATSSNSKGSVGSWALDGLSTPGTFLVSASKDGLSMESGLLTLAAGGSGTLNLTLKAGVGALTGQVDGPDSLGSVAGVGGATVTVTDGTITRTATTVTSGPVGRYTLPSLPVPGSYTATIAGDGYLPQTQKVTFAAGQSSATASATLRSSTVTVAGTVTDSNGLGLAGAGLVLTGPAGTYKTMSLSDPLGSFGFSGVSPGTYVLSAEVYGRITGYATVVAEVDGTPPVSLKLASTPGGVLPATSHIRGRITDARSGGQLNCDQADGYDPTDPGSAANKALCKLDVGVDVSAADVTAACAGAASTNPMVVCGVDPSQEYTVPSIDQQPAPGLLPGLHHLVVSAPGYETGTLDVQVPVAVTTEAATLALFPGATVVGTINAAVGNLSTGPDPTKPDDPDESVPAGQDYAHQVDYRTCVIVGPASPAPSGQPSCTLVPPAAPGGQPTCSTDLAGAKCVLTSVATGSYAVRGLAHGSYLVFVDPLNPEYLPIAGVQMILDKGGVGRYDANVHRLGRLVLSVMSPNSSGGLVNAPGAAVTVTPDPTITQPNLVAGVAGRVMIIGLPAGAHVLTATQDLYSGSASVPVGQDQEVTAELAMTQSVTQVIGQVTSSYTGSAKGVAGATVTISGVVAYSGIVPIRAQVSVTTDANGCFAITKDGTAPTPLVTDPNAPPRPCVTSIPSTPPGRLALVLGQADVSITAPDFDPYSVTGLPVSSGSLLATGLAPTAQAISGTLSVSPADSSVHLSGAIITVNRKAPGAGVVDVTAADNGTLTWQDSEYPQANQVRPGDYRLTASLTGYAPTTVDVTCALGAACTVPTFQLQKLGSLAISTVDGGGNPVTNAVFVLSGGGSPPETQTAPPGSSQVQFTGLLPGAAYSVRIQAAGYAFGSTGPDIGVQCPAGGATSIAITPGDQTSCVATLTQRGTISGTAQAVFGGGTTQALSNVALTATYCGATASSIADCPSSAATDGSAFSTVSAADGSFRITGSNAREGLLPGGWRLDYTASGYSTTGPQFVQVVAGNNPVTANLNAQTVTLKVGVASSDSHAAADLITNATLTLTPVDGSGSANTQTTVGAGNLYVFGSILPTTYSLQVSGSDIAPLTVQVNVLVGVSTQTIYVRIDIRTNSIAGIVSAIQGTDQVATALDGATVSLIKTSDGSTQATATSGSSAGSGYYQFATVPDGNYLVRFAKAGYVTSDKPTAVSAGQNVTISPTLDRVTNNVVVNLTSTNGFPLAGAQATLTANPVAGAPAQAPVALTGSGTAYTATFNSVPAGSWTVWVSLPANHFGTVKSGASSVTSAAPLPVTVSGSPNTASTVNLSLAESELDLAVPVTPLDADLNTPPSSVALAVTQAGKSVFSATSFDTSSGGSAGGSTNTVPIWVTPGLAYTLTATPDSSLAPAWVANSATVNPTSSSTPVPATVTLAEQGGTLQVTVQNSSNAKVNGAQVSLSTTDSTISPPDPITTGATGIVTFSGSLPAGTYTVSVTKSTSGGGTLTGSGTVTVDLSKTAKVTITVN